jgi:hypothetical protein
MSALLGESTAACIQDKRGFYWIKYSQICLVTQLVTQGTKNQWLCKTDGRVGQIVSIGIICRGTKLEWPHNTDGRWRQMTVRTDLTVVEYSASIFGQLCVASRVQQQMLLFQWFVLASASWRKAEFNLSQPNLWLICNVTYINLQCDMHKLQGVLLSIFFHVCFRLRQPPSCRYWCVPVKCAPPTALAVVSTSRPGDPSLSNSRRSRYRNMYVQNFHRKMILIRSLPMSHPLTVILNLFNEEGQSLNIYFQRQ